MIPSYSTFDCLEKNLIPLSRYLHTVHQTVLTINRSYAYEVMKNIPVYNFNDICKVLKNIVNTMSLLN